MGLNVFHTGEILHDVCLVGGRLLVMLCNDGCKELHPHAVRLVTMAMLHARWERMQDRHLERLPDQKAGRAFLTARSLSWSQRAPGRREGLMERFRQGVSCQTQKG